MDIVGREDAIEQVTHRLTLSRLVTVTGPGGMGKTTLAEAVAEAVGHSYELGVHRVDLTRIESDADVGGAIAAQLGFGSFNSLLASPSDQPALVLVDNCEHVLDAAADAIERLLAACQAPTVLATSRSPLGLGDESVVALGPLALPPVGLLDADAAAVRLFRRRAADAGAVEGTDDLDAIVRLCHLLDGVPLAIELAAARARVLAPAELLDRLDVLDTLRRPRSRGPTRHRSLRDTIEWSYSMLDDGDRAFFDRLAVLTGPFTADDAAVAAAPGEPDASVVDRLERLLDASLLTSEVVTGVTHHRQLELVRSYAAERLRERGEWDRTWRRFVDHVTERSIRLALETATGWTGTALATLLSRVDHQLAVLRWCVRDDDAPDRCFALIASLWGVVHQGRVDEISPLVERALERWPDPSSPLWADAAATAATCRYLLGRPGDAISLARSALPAAASSVYAPCTLRRLLAHASCSTGDLDGAITSLDEAIALATRVPALAMEMTVSRAQIAGTRGEVTAGLDAVRAVARDAAARGALVNEAWARSVEAALLARHDPDAATAVALSALEQARRAMYPACESVNLHTLATVDIERGHLHHAATRLLDLIDGLVTRGAEGELRNAVRTSAVVLHRCGDHRWADLAATALAMPVVSLFELPGYERLGLPDSPVPPIPRAAAIVLARSALTQIAGDIGEVTATPVAAQPDKRPEAPAAAPTNRWYRLGDVWTIEFGGATVHLTASKGLADLGRLVASPGTDLHCLDLAEATVEEHASGEVLDEQARREYERRVRELQAEIDEAERDHDLGRSDRARVELDAIVDHLTAALGLHGRARRHTDTTERARSAVTQRIRATIRRIDPEHPALAAHLRASIQTGIYCRYQPEHATTWATHEPG